MRKLFALLALIAVSFAAPSRSAAQTPTPPGQPADEPATKFEKVLLTKGSLAIREYHNLGTINSRMGSAAFEVAAVYAPGSASRTTALRVSVKESGRLERERIGVLDREEVASLAKALPEMAKMAELLKSSQGPSQEDGSTEAVFSGGSLKFTAFVGRRRGDGLVIHAGTIGGTQAYFELSDLPRITSLVAEAIAKMNALDQKR